jgi:hypothetical protein
VLALPPVNESAGLDAVGTSVVDGSWVASKSPVANFIKHFSSVIY